MEYRLIDLLLLVQLVASALPKSAVQAVKVIGIASAAAVAVAGFAHLVHRIMQAGVKRQGTL